MPETYTEPVRDKFTPKTSFGVAVAESGFGRVCPRCFKKWSDRPTWIRETVSGEPVMTTAGRCGVRVCSCGGGMLTEGRSEVRQAEKVAAAERDRKVKEK